MLSAWVAQPATNKEAAAAAKIRPVFFIVIYPLDNGWELFLLSTKSAFIFYLVPNKRLNRKLCLNKRQRTVYSCLHELLQALCNKILKYFVLFGHFLNRFVRFTLLSIKIWSKQLNDRLGATTLSKMTMLFSAEI